MAADIPSHGVPLPNATATGTAMTLAPTATLPFLTDNVDVSALGFFFTQPVSTQQLVVVLSYCSSCYAAGHFHLPLWHPM